MPGYDADATILGQGEVARDLGRSQPIPHMSVGSTEGENMPRQGVVPGRPGFTQ